MDKIIKIWLADHKIEMAQERIDILKAMLKARQEQAFPLLRDGNSDYTRGFNDCLMEIRQMLDN